MPIFPFRIAGFLLVPCLISGCAQASTLITSAATRDFITPVSAFEQEALEPDLLFGPLRNLADKSFGARLHKAARSVHTISIQPNASEHLFHPIRSVFAPEKRRMTYVDADQHVRLLPQFDHLLGHLNQSAIQRREIPGLPVVALWVPERAKRWSAKHVSQNTQDCPICKLIELRKKDVLNVGHGFEAVPELFPYFDNPGTIVRKTHGLPQIDQDLITSMLQTLYELGSLGYRIGYNHRDTGGKITHQSYKVFQQPLTIEAASTTLFLEYEGLRISRIEQFPVEGFVIEATSFGPLLKEIQRMDMLLSMLDIPFNLLLTAPSADKIKIFVELRNARGERPRAFPHKFFGVIEASGLILFESRKDFARKDLANAIRKSYTDLTPEPLNIEQLTYIYKAHAAIALAADRKNLDYTIDASGNLFYAFSIPSLGEVLKYFKKGDSSDYYDAYFHQGFRLVQRYLGKLFTPTEAVGIDQQGNFFKLPANEPPLYVIQQLVEGPSLADQTDLELTKKNPSAKKIIQAWERMIAWRAHLLAAGVFDIDAPKFDVNVRGTGMIKGFDLSHLRSLFSGVNLFGPGGYVEEWEEVFERAITQVEDRSVMVGQALRRRFSGFQWKDEMTRRGLKIPRRHQDLIAARMPTWRPKLFDLSANRKKRITSGAAA
jgi:hypothetical protein